LFLAGNNRYQMLKHGTALAAWVKSKGLPEGGLYGWAPFGLHDTKRWVEGRGISYLFDDSPLVHAGEAMLLPGFEGWLGLPWKERLGGWMMTERAGLSYPLSRKSMDGTTKQWSVGEHLAGFLWFDRVVRAVGRGLDPTLLRPLGDVDYIPSGDRATFLRWRQRIWGHYFSGLGDLTKLAHKEWGAKEDGVLPAVSLVKPVGDLWRAWQRPWLPKV